MGKNTNDDSSPILLIVALLLFALIIAVQFHLLQHCAEKQL